MDIMTEQLLENMEDMSYSHQDLRKIYSLSSVNDKSFARTIDFLLKEKIFEKKPQNGTAYYCLTVYGRRKARKIKHKNDKHKGW